MAVEVLMPALSPTMTEGKLSKWSKSVGDAVKPGDILAEIETDKATMEVEAVEEGVLDQILVPAGTEGVARGAYTLVDTDGAPDVVLIGTGSEVSVCVDAAATLAERGVKARVVSMPCWSLFDRQTDQYRAAVFPDGVPRVSIEAGVTLGWSRYADLSIGIERFGESAPGDVVLDKLGINPTNLVERTLGLLESRRNPR